MSDITTLYRLFAVDGSLLYVGIAKNWPLRLATHSGEKVWWSEVVVTTVQRFPTRLEAEYAEGIAIRGERPRYNVALGRRPVRIEPSTVRRPVIRTQSRRWQRAWAGRMIRRAEELARRRASYDEDFEDGLGTIRLVDVTPNPATADSAAAKWHLRARGVTYEDVIPSSRELALEKAVWKRWDELFA